MSMLGHLDNLRQKYEVMKEFSAPHMSKMVPSQFDIMVRMAEEIIRLRKTERILAALREPSDEVVSAAEHYVLTFNEPDYDDIRSAIRAAVAAAEKEVGA